MMRILYWALKKILPTQSHEDILFFFFYFINLPFIPKSTTHLEYIFV